MTDALSQSEAAAERIRSELERTVAELDRRRREALDVRLQVRRHAVGLGLTGAALLAIAGTVIAVAIVRRKSRPRRLREQRLEGLVRAWRHPRRLAAPVKKPGVELATKVLTAALSAVASQLARRGTAALVGAPEEAD